MKPAEISEITIAAYSKGFKDGGKRATERARRVVQSSHALEHQLMEETIVRELGPAAWDQVREALIAAKTAQAGDIMSSLGSVMERMGLGEEMSKLVKLFEQDTADGRATVFGLDMTDGRGVEFGSFGHGGLDGEEPTEQQPDVPLNGDLDQEAALAN